MHFEFVCLLMYVWHAGHQNRVETNTRSHLYDRESTVSVDRTRIGMQRLSRIDPFFYQILYVVPLPVYPMLAEELFNTISVTGRTGILHRHVSHMTPSYLPFKVGNFIYHHFVTGVPLFNNTMNNSFVFIFHPTHKRFTRQLL